MNRQETLKRIRAQEELPVLVIGAGINGIGTFRDLAAQDIPTLIIDKGDFCSGASAGSSHMLHGGIRYLENAEFRLVSEALTERNLMLRNAPHYAKPLPTTIPIFSWFSGILNSPLKFIGLRDKPSERGAIVIKFGLMMYDYFARRHRVMPTHDFRLKKAALERFPQLNPDIICTASYYDAWMPSPERICIDLLTDAVSMSENAHALNYVSAVDADQDTVTLRDELSGETFTVKPGIVINAGGPWIDFVNRAMDQDTKFIGGTKGAHLIVENPELNKALNGSEVFFENDDGRIVLILPYVDKVIIGTTDIRVENPDDAWVTEDEVQYILDMVPKVFPNIQVDISQVIFHFSGVRPLPASDESRTGAVSRDHHIKSVSPAQSGYKFPIHSLVGGKWTSFRAFSEETADVVMEHLGKTRVRSTEHMAIGGGKDYPAEDQQANWIRSVSTETGVPQERVETLFERYGTHARRIAEFIAQEGNDRPITDAPTYSKHEIVFLIRNEMVTRIEDIVLRRSLIAWLGQLTDGLVQDLAEICAVELNWTPQQRAAALEQAVRELNDRYAQNLNVSVVA